MIHALPLLGVMSEVTGDTPPPDEPPVAGYSVWIDAQSIEGDEGDPVALWENQGSAPGDFAAVTAPTLRKNLANGKQAVRFTGPSNQSMQIDDLTGLPAGASTIFIVAKGANGSNDSGGAQYVFDTSGDDDLTSRRFAFRLFNINVRRGINATEGELTAALASREGAIEQYNVTFNDASSLLRVNQEDVATSDIDSGAGAWTAFALGSNYSNTGNWLNTDLYELIWYPSILSDSDRNEVEAYLTAKYALGPSTAKIQWWMDAREIPVVADGTSLANLPVEVSHNRYVVTCQGVNAGPGSPPQYFSTPAPRVRFIKSGSNASLMGGNSYANLPDGPYTVFYVGVLRRPAGGGGLTQVIYYGGSPIQVGQMDDTGIWAYSADGPIFIKNNDYTDGEIAVVSFTVNGASSSIRINGAREVTGTVTTAGLSWGDCQFGAYGGGVGDHYGLDGDMLELMVCDLMGDTERNVWEQILLAKHGIDPE